jgi:hypothetical protein
MSDSYTTTLRHKFNRAEMPTEYLMRPEISKLIASYKDPFASE